MPSMEHIYRWPLAVFKAKSQNNEKSNTELELFELLYPITLYYYCAHYLSVLTQNHPLTHNILVQLDTDQL